MLRHGQLRVRRNGHLLLILLVTAVPYLSLRVFGGRPTPTARQEPSEGTAHLKFYETRDILLNFVTVL